jgi:hypothetical protein
MSISKKNAEGYFDPTAFEALTAVAKTERTPKTDYQRVYICSPYRGDTEINAANALRYCRFAVKQGFFPLAPHCYLPLFMNDDIPAERELALSFGLRLLHGCRELWVFGEVISEGMKREIDASKRQSIKIRRFTADCKEVT